MSNIPKKSLGQHWLRDDSSLLAMVQAAEVAEGDVVLEIGPGLGTLTQKLIDAGAEVLALEYDESLMGGLRIKFGNLPSSQFFLEHGDILKYDFSKQPDGYKIVANIPYYLTSHLLRILSEPATHKPVKAALLVQKEVAERVAAEPGDMSTLSVAIQLEYEVSLGQVVPAKLFEPPPKVDSQILILTKRPKPLYADVDRKLFMRTVKSGFAGKRKVLRNSISAGLQIDKTTAEAHLKKAGIDPGARAQSLDLADWARLTRQVELK